MRNVLRPPVEMTHEVEGRLVRLTITEIPTNLSNSRLPGYRHPSRGPSKASMTWLWRDRVAMLGASARAAARWPIAGPTVRAVVTITFHKCWPPFDKDGRYNAAKPLLDGLKVEAGRRRDRSPVLGCGLIWDDGGDEDDQDEAARRLVYRVGQQRVMTQREQRTVIEVTREAP